MPLYEDYVIIYRCPLNLYEMGAEPMEETCFRNKVSPIWDVMICKDLYELPPNEERFIQDCADHYGANTPAEEIIEYANRYFAAGSGFAAGVSKSSDDDMQWLGLDKNILISTLKANLYCVLLLETMGQTADTFNLLTLINKQSEAFEDGLSMQEFSTALSNFPDVLKELFSIGERERDSMPHRIATRYHRLLFAELKCVRNMPLTALGSTPNSFKLNQRYYNECVNIIKAGPDWTAEGIAQYYLFERIFRLNAKSTLFWGEHHYIAGGDSASPVLLADCLFPSPLVLLPQGMLVELLYNKWNVERIHEKQANGLRFLIRLSFQFLYSLETLRVYMRKHDIRSPEQVTSFFFPGKDDFSNLIAKFEIDEFSPTDDSPERKIIKAYSSRWSAFAPSISPSFLQALAPFRQSVSITSSADFIGALTPLNRGSWAINALKKYDDPIDEKISKRLQKRL